ncbi:hypothetical protein [Elizabethkingia anophelis]|uniref:hypothetical protein n=1 Tax=Elizabethkingia anophelis TaxID=1117645 RepID=UPI00099AC297|nr:hypothetical protein [Elizabethkingia anophelis]OPC44648.1 hypothetical protein BAY05_14140 [Elizabethkingia anophelis]
MPNRVIRDWTDSERVDQVSFQAEALFIRLMMKADDYGSYHGNPRLINSFCFPLKNLRDTDISRWLHELVSAGLIAAYDADNKQYIHIVNFDQRLRQVKAKFPQIPENVLNNFVDKNSLTNGGQVADRLPLEEETETEEETEGEEERKVPPPEKENLNFPEGFSIVWKDWIEFKKELKDSYKTVKSEQAALDKLAKLANDNAETAKLIVEQSIEREWKGLFALKGDFPPRKQVQDSLIISKRRKL